MAVHELPFQDSDDAVFPGVKNPPNAKAAVAVPAPPGPYLEVPKLLTSVHAVPLYSSVFDVFGLGGSPLPAKTKTES